MPSYVVVGASRGLGLAYLRVISEKPENTVFALARDLNGATELRELSQNAPHKNIHTVKLDLTNLQSIKDAAAAVGRATGGAIDVLITNAALMYHPRAGVPLDSYPDDQTLEDDLLLFFKTNTIGTTHTLNAFLPLIMAGQTKKIIVVTSQMGSPHYALGAKNTFAPCYSISKAGLNMVVAKFAANEKNRDAGLTIVGISPGLMKTATGLPQEEIDKIFERILEQCKAYDPDMFIIDVEDSARQQLGVLEKLTPADSGSLMHWDGKKFI